VSTARDPTQRLIELERILAQSRLVTASGHEQAGSVTSHLAGVPVDRIRQLTSALQRGLDDTVDEIDAVAMRLLLNDFRIAVPHLRAIAQTAGARMDDAADLIREGQRFVRREQKLESRATQRVDGTSQS
jgi:hypothetical protein